MTEFLRLLAQQRGVWYMPFTLVAFILFGLLLFAAELPDGMRHYLLPSLVVFLLGIVLITFGKTLHHARYNTTRSPEERRADPNLPTGTLWIYIGLLMGWFIAFIVYNVWRGVF